MPEATLIPSELDLRARARTIPRSKRSHMISDLLETELHRYLKNLLQNLEREATVAITHGPGELGKDLVLVKDEPLGTRVVAFVVKRGKLSGKAHGLISEIKEQVQEALTHPAHLDEFVKPLQVKQVYIVVAGPVSATARTRLQAESLGSVQEVWDLDRLTSLFTDYYPALFFDAESIDYIQTKITSLERHTMFSRVATDTNLSEWFVNPVVGVTEVLDAIEKLDVNKIRRLPFAELRTLMKPRDSILLIGEPGSGKSAAVAKIAIDMLKEAFQQATKDRKKGVIPVPILLTARQFLQYMTPDDLIIGEIGEEERTEFSTAAILIDGLDEVRSADRKAVLERAASFAKQLACPLMATSRFVEAVRSPVQEFDRVELLPFEYPQVVRLFEKIVPESWVRDVLIEGLDQIRGQIQLTPLSLRLLIDVVREHQEIPASVTDLYERFFDEVLGRYDHQKEIEVVFEHTLKKYFLSELAFVEFFNNDLFLIARDDFDRFCLSFSNRYKWDVAQFQRFVEEIDRAGILRVGEEVEFQHRSFLDYFVAFHINRTKDRIESLQDLLTTTYFNDFWSDVTFFYVGLNRELDDRTMDAINRRVASDLGSAVLKLMAGRLLQAG